jgi:hypothetical protein
MLRTLTKLKIKNFGNDKEYESVDELRAALSDEYRGTHVSVVYPVKPTGMLRTVYVSVCDAGTVSETYGEGEPLDFTRISETILN